MAQVLLALVIDAVTGKNSSRVGISGACIMSGLYGISIAQHARPPSWGQRVIGCLESGAVPSFEI